MVLFTTTEVPTKNYIYFGILPTVAGERNGQ